MKPSQASLFAVLAFAIACKDKATAECQSQMTSAQAIVAKVDGSSAASVQTALGAVETALTACRAASRSTESEQLSAARSELRTHLDALSHRKGRKKKAEPSASEVEELVKHGDTSCPRGMAYKAEGSDRQIRCTGPQPIRMNFAAARAYYTGLGYRLTVADNPPQLKAEYGAELLVFSYAAPNDEKAPRCLTLYPPPQMPWQEAVARATGGQLNKIKNGAPVPLPDGDVPLQVEEGNDKLIVRLGSCGS